MPSVTWLFLLFHLYVFLVGYCYAPLRNEVLTGVGGDTKWGKKKTKLLKNVIKHDLLHKTTKVKMNTGKLFSSGSPRPKQQIKHPL